MAKSFKVAFSTALLSCVFVCGLASEVCFAQWNPSLIRADYGKNSQIQYSPDDPSTRSRLFKLQTGQAGAFYNCDGEEDKRNSPFICWKSSNGEHCRRTFLDVLDWRGDRAEIFQRICDGVGGCCSECATCDQGNCRAPATVAPAVSCGCSTCVAAAKGNGVKQQSVLQLAHAVKSQPKPTQTAKTLLPRSDGSGLVTAQVRISEPNESAKSTNVKPPTRSASLLERVRASQKQR